MSKVRAYATTAADQPLKPFEYQMNGLGAEEIEIEVQYCGICHSDLSMIENHWGMTAYPIVPGHEVSGIVAAVGKSVQNLKPGDRVGLGLEFEKLYDLRLLSFRRS